jgi:phosphate transport system permease protein
MGWSILAGGLTLALLVLPTIIRVSEEAIRTVPSGYRDVSFSLGATRWQMVTTAVLPSALSGIATGVILAFGRAVSETAVVRIGSARRRWPSRAASSSASASLAPWPSNPRCC